MKPLFDEALLKHHQYARPRQRRVKLVRKCLRCRQVFSPETRFMFMCVPCRREPGGLA